jgi:hypothetical protein
MMNVAEYLSNYREEEPTWLGRHLRNEQLTFKVPHLRAMWR